MGGELLDYPAKRILNEGRAMERELMVRNLMQSLDTTVEKACELLRVSVDDFKAPRRKFKLLQ